MTINEKLQDNMNICTKPLLEWTKILYSLGVEVDHHGIYRCYWMELIDVLEQKNLFGEWHWNSCLNTRLFIFHKRAVSLLIFKMDEIERGQQPIPQLQDSSQVNNNNTPGTSDNSKRCTTSPVHQALKSLSISCIMCGLIFRKNFAAKGYKRHMHPSHIYSLILILFLTTNVFRWLTMFHGNEAFGSILFIKITYCAWSLETLAHHMACFIANESHSRLPMFFDEWEKIRQHCAQSMNAIKRQTNVGTAVLWILVLANTGFCAYLIFVTDLQDVLLTPWNRESKFVVVIQMVNLIQQFYLTFVWFATSIFMFLICNTLAFEFKEVRQGIERMTCGKAAECVDNLEGLRRQHQNLCNLVEKADRMFSMQIAISLSGSLVISCLVLYTLIYDDHSNTNGTGMIVIKVFWVCTALAKVIIDCISGAILNDAVSSYTSLVVT